MNRTWVWGSTVKCKIHCFDDVNEMGHKRRPLEDLKAKFGSSYKHHISSNPTMIRVKNLFMMVSAMGGEGFTDAVCSLRQQGDMTEIVVLSGIHGTQLGLEMVGTRLTHRCGGFGNCSKGMVDENLLTQDEEELELLEKGKGHSATPKKNRFFLRNIVDLKVRVERLYRESNSARKNVTYAKIKGTTEELLKDGKYVFWSWCHSLFSTRTSTPQACFNKAIRIDAKTVRQPWDILWKNNTVKQIVRSDFGWVPDPL
jgi:hypothetical protein